MYGQPLLNVQQGERMYKWFIIRPHWGRQADYELRIITKEKTDGVLELVAYNFLIVNGRRIKRDINRAPNVLKEELDTVIHNILTGLEVRPEEMETVDLSSFQTVDEQIAYLKERDRVETHYVA